MREIKLGDEVLGALEHVWGTLEPFRLPMAVMGGIAVSFWEHIRATRDVDVLIQMTTANAETILEALRQAKIRPKSQPPVVDLGTAKLMQLLYEPPGFFVDIRIDLLFAESDYQRLALARRVAARLPRFKREVFVLSCEDLIIHKLLAGRIIDKADAAALLRTNRARLDSDYLQEWIGQLGLNSAWAEIWREAFPEEEASISS